MAEGRELALVCKGPRQIDADAATPESLGESPGQAVRAGIEAAAEIAETNPEGARSALWHLQQQWLAMEEPTVPVGWEPTRTAFGIGFAIQMARAELSRPRPCLRRRVPELLTWIGERD